MLKSALAKAATAKVAIVLAAVGGGGVALAAGSGHLPGVGTPSDHATGRPAAGVTASEHATAAAHGSSSAAGHASSNGTAHGSSSGAAHGSAAPDASPSPNLRGLCTAFQAGVADSAGKALDNPAFTMLINSAGGKDQVAGYCTTLLATPAGAASTDAARTSHGRPPAPPSNAPSSHPTGPEQTPSHHEPTAPPTHSH
jgi:hypothetical protein